MTWNFKGPSGKSSSGPRTSPSNQRRHRFLAVSET